MLAELMEEAGLPKGILQVVNGDKEAVDAIPDNDTIQSVSFGVHTDCGIYLWPWLCKRQTGSVFWRRETNMIVMPDADMDQAADVLAVQAMARRANAVWRFQWPYPWAKRPQIV